MRASTMIKPTVQRMADLLAPCGFRKRATRFNRRMPDDRIVHVIELQLATHEWFRAFGVARSAPRPLRHLHGQHRRLRSRGGLAAAVAGRLGRRTRLPASSPHRGVIGRAEGPLVAGRLGGRCRRRARRVGHSGTALARSSHGVEAILRVHDLAPELLGLRVQASRWPYELYLSRGRTQEARRAFAAYLSHGPLNPNAVSNLRTWLQAQELHEWEPMLNAVPGAVEMTGRSGASRTALHRTQGDLVVETQWQGHGKRCPPRCVLPPPVAHLRQASLRHPGGCASCRHGRPGGAGRDPVTPGWVPGFG